MYKDLWCVINFTVSNDSPCSCTFLGLPVGWTSVSKQANSKYNYPPFTASN